MRLASFIVKDRTSYGVVDRGMVREASAEFRREYADLRAVLAANRIDDLAEAMRGPLKPSEVVFLPPIPNPDKIICIGHNYSAHIKEMGREAGEHPAVFTRYPSSVVGHEAKLVRPAASETYDFEGEFAVVIGRAGRAIPPEAALEHVAGYTCFMDGSIREYQRHTTQFWPGKNFAATGAMGPWIVTAEEIGDPGGQHLSTRLNGTEVQSAPVSDLAFPVPDLIAYLSTVIELLPGDVIATGTPGGVGAARKPPLWLKAGDRVEVEISGIGILSNTVVDEV